MRGRAIVVLGLVAALAGCSTTIVKLNERPDKYYQQKVTFTGRLTRTQQVDSDTLAEVADSNEHRILVRSAAPPEMEIGSWVKVNGILVPEARVGDKVLYDIVLAEKIGRTRRPLFAGLL